MLQFRIKIIECVMGSESPERVENRMFEVIQREVQTGIPVKRIIQAMPVLEADMSFQMRLEHSEKELANIKEALRLFRQGIQLEHI